MLRLGAKVMITINALNLCGMFPCRRSAQCIVRQTGRIGDVELGCKISGDISRDGDRIIEKSTEEAYGAKLSSKALPPGMVSRAQVDMRSISIVEMEEEG